MATSFDIIFFKIENWILGETHVYDFDLWRFFVSLRKIEESECVAPSAEQNYAIFVTTVYGGKQHAEIGGKYWK